MAVSLCCLHEFWREIEQLDIVLSWEKQRFPRFCKTEWLDHSGSTQKRESSLRVSKRGHFIQEFLTQMMRELRRQRDSVRKPFASPEEEMKEGHGDPGSQELGPLGRRRRSLCSRTAVWCVSRSPTARVSPEAERKEETFSGFSLLLSSGIQPVPLMG